MPNHFNFRFARVSLSEGAAKAALTRAAAVKMLLKSIAKNGSDEEIGAALFSGSREKMFLYTELSFFFMTDLSVINTDHHLRRCGAIAQQCHSVIKNNLLEAALAI